MEVHGLLVSEEAVVLRPKGVDTLQTLGFVGKGCVSQQGFLGGRVWEVGVGYWALGGRRVLVSSPGLRM